jgi:hypothetical protein
MGTAGRCAMAGPVGVVTAVEDLPRAARPLTTDRTWDKVLSAAQLGHDGQPVERDISVGFSVVRTHQHAADASTCNRQGRSP